MSSEDEDNKQEIDTGLSCLVLLARFHQVAAEPGQLKHHFGKAESGVF